jgi:hypothetical protein
MRPDQRKGSGGKGSGGMMDRPLKSTATASSGQMLGTEAHKRGNGERKKQTEMKVDPNSLLIP